MKKKKHKNKRDQPQLHRWLPIEIFLILTMFQIVQDPQRSHWLTQAIQLLTHSVR